MWEAVIVIPRQDAMRERIPPWKTHPRWKTREFRCGGSRLAKSVIFPRMQIIPDMHGSIFPFLKPMNFMGWEQDRPPNRRGPQVAMFNRDALGYDATHSDPLYKSIPFMIKINCRQNVVCGIYMDSPSISCIDLGHESRFYCYWETKGGPEPYYLFMGDGYRDIVREYCTITGFPALPPCSVSGSTRVFHELYRAD